MKIVIKDILTSILSKEELKLLDIIKQKPLPFTIRLNILRMKESNFETLLTNQGIKFSKCPYLSYAYQINYIPPDSTDWIIRLRLLGYYYAQNFSSLLPPLAFNFEHINLTNFMLIDTCAAPGSKTTQLSAMFNNQGLIIANDHSKKNHRTYILHRNLKLTGALNVIISNEDARKLGQKWTNRFDAALVDAPCTGTGVIRQRNVPDRENEDLKRIQKREFDILNNAIQMVKPGGIIIYSTCSFLPQENELVIKPFLDSEVVELDPIKIKNLNAHPGINEFNGIDFPFFKNVLRIYPFDYDSVGFFIAKLKVKDNNDTKMLDSIEMSNPVLNTSSNDIKHIKNEENFSGFWNLCENNWGIKKDNWTLRHSLIKNRKGRIWMTTRCADTFLKDRKHWHPPDRLAVSIAQEEKNGQETRLTIDGVLVFCNDISKNIVYLTESQIDDWFAGKDLFLQDNQIKEINSRYFILKSKENIVLGCSKISNNLLINFLPKFRYHISSKDKFPQKSSEPSLFHSEIEDE
ncbi:MAG: RsmB/NOP family class I SAM-dependent RNA methyltransferase [Candidatus Thorarchaeota archaeon]